MGTNRSAGGAVGAVLGGPGDGRALKREFIVFLKENISLRRVREAPRAAKPEGWAPSGALPGAFGRPEDAFRSVGGAQKGLRSALGGRPGGPGSPFGSSRTDFRGSSY